MTPREALTLDQVDSLPSDTVETDDHWIVIDGGDVALCAQRTGEAPTQEIKLPRATFEAFIDWYNTGEFKRPRKRPGKRKATP